MTRTKHICIDVRGAILNARDPGSTASSFTHSDGRPATVDEAVAFLMDELAKGHKVIPFGEPCEGFDYSGGGCPGHDKAEPVRADH